MPAWIGTNIKAKMTIIKNSNPGELKVMVLSSDWDPDNCISNEITENIATIDIAKKSLLKSNCCRPVIIDIKGFWCNRVTTTYSVIKANTNGTKANIKLGMYDGPAIMKLSVLQLNPVIS